MHTAVLKVAKVKPDVHQVGQAASAASRGCPRPCLVRWGWQLQLYRILLSQVRQSVTECCTAVTHLLQAASGGCRGASERGQEVPKPVLPKQVPKSGLCCLLHVNTDDLRCSIAQDELRC